MNAITKYVNYLRHSTNPVLWPEFGRRLKRKLLDPQYAALEDPSRRAATEWCETIGIGSAEALEELKLPSGALVDVRSRHAEVFRQAEERVAICPIKLGGAGHLDLLYSLCEYLQATRVVETGVAYGWSSLALLLSVATRPEGRLVSVDLPYLHLANDRFVGIAVPAEFRDRWRVFRMADREGLPRALTDLTQIDLAHYDSDKSPAGRLFAYQLIWEVLRPGGILISDDVGDNLAFCDFCLNIGIKPTVVQWNGKWQGLARKT